MATVLLRRHCGSLSEAEQSRPGGRSTGNNLARKIEIIGQLNASGKYLKNVVEIRRNTQKHPINTQKHPIKNPKQKHRNLLVATWVINTETSHKLSYKRGNLGCCKARHKASPYSWRESGERKAYFETTIFRVAANSPAVNV